MPRMKYVDFSGYRPEGHNKRGLTAVYMASPSNHDRAKRRRTEYGSGVTPGACTFSAPSPPHARTVFTPPALKATNEEVPVVHKPSHDADFDLLLQQAQDHEVATRAAYDAAEEQLHEATKRVALLAFDLLECRSRKLKLCDLAEEQEADAAEKAKVVEEAGATTFDLQRKLAESRAQADAAKCKKDDLLHGLSHEPFHDCPHEYDVHLAKLLNEHEARHKKVKALRAQWYRVLRVLRGEWYDAGDVDFVSYSLRRLSCSENLLPPHVLALLSVEDAKCAQDTGRAQAEELHLAAEARYLEIVDEVGTLPPCLDTRPSIDARKLAEAEGDLVRKSAVISAFKLFHTAEANKRMDVQRACNECDEAMSDVSRYEELLAEATAHEQEALAKHKKAHQVVIETREDIDKVGADMTNLKNRMVDYEEAVMEVVIMAREAWDGAVLTVSQTKELCDSAVLPTACVWP